MDLRLKNLANTNVLCWGGRLFALFEAGHPCRLDPRELTFLGEDDLQGLLRPGMAASSGNDVVDKVLSMGGSAFTAHPKMDPLQRRLVGFSWAGKDGGVELRVHEWDEAFAPLSDFPADGIRHLCPDCDAQPHDFGLTPKRYVFFENRIKMGDLGSYLLGVKGATQCLVSSPEQPQRIHVVPRIGHGSSSSSDGLALSLEGSGSAFDVHVAHCHDGPPLLWDGNCDSNDEDLVTVYTSGWDFLPEGPFLGSWGSEGKDWPFELPESALAADFAGVPRARLLRHVLDVREGKVLDRRPAPGCEELCMEHPVINCSFTGDANCRYIYMVIGNECGLSTPPCGWAKVDLATGTAQRWYAGSRHVTEEPHFVPRHRPQGSWSPGAPGGAEDDGWLLGAMFDAGRNQSCLCVFDTKKFEQGPIGRIWLPHAVPHGLHGCFVPNDDV
eukprot:TRINITY_DN40093_c0_g1_i1.p1 TRINITY_DN40093_c0_g1~~TRINITY_DN40093_c0_g1_i1.p1  ORF type:complete len:483 (-),score=79.27 TRINITY_DN40093_c0_g1_i1:349-1671(-)